jgi:hypothetical protein
MGMRRVDSRGFVLLLLLSCLVPAWGQHQPMAPQARQESATDLEKEFGEDKAGPASPLQWRGSIWNKFTHDTATESPLEDDLSNHFEAQFEIQYALHRQVSIVLAFEANSFAYGNNTADLSHDGEINLYNAYVHLTFPHVNVRLGQQIVTWGKIDEVSPLDNVNPEDFRDGFVRPRAERKLPIPMMHVEFTHDVYTVQGIFIPFFVGHKIDLRGTDWAFFDHLDRDIGPFGVRQDTPPGDLRSSEGGLRFSGKFKALDYAMSYLYAHEDFPTLRSLIAPPALPLPARTPTWRDLGRFAQFTGQTIQLEHRRQHIVGLEFETTIGSFGLRGDVAYFHKRSFFTHTLQAIQRPVWQYAVGIDYSGPNNLYLNVQFSQSVIQDYDNATLFFDELTSELYGKISHDVWRDVALALRYFYNITSNSFYVHPHVVFKFWQNTHVEIGADLLDGPKDTPVGLFRNNDQIYGILKIFF